MIRWMKRLVKALIVAAVVVVIDLAIGKVANIYAFWDDDAERGAIGMPGDAFGEAFDTPTYLAQNWEPKDSLWFYTITQGSGLLPYDLFMVLEQKDSTELFRSNANINRFRYLPQKATWSNADALPVGFVKDSYEGKTYLGLTCAACHTSQINYGGKAIRIDGGPATADMNSFLVELGHALDATVKDDNKRKRFMERVMDRNGVGKRFTGGRSYTSQDEVLADLNTFTQRVIRYNTINHSHLEYGYARLDAFGRIFNRVLEHIITKDQLTEAIKEVLPADEAAQIMDGVTKDIIETGTLDHLVTKMESHASLKQLLRIRNKLFNEPDAPVSYPYMWDIAQHDYVQWNGIAANAGLGPIGRNAGEVVGVFAILDWQEKPGRSLSAWIGGQRGLERHFSYKSSIRIGNLRRIEAKLSELQSPQWPALLPPIDVQRARKGKEHFKKYCQSCHLDIQRADKMRNVIAQMTKLSVVQTDPKMAANATNYIGYSGITEGQYLMTNAGRIFIEPKAPVGALLTIATTNVVATPDSTQNFIQRWGEWAYELAFAYFDSDTLATIKRGDYDPDTAAAPWASLSAYKARPLNGIWATAPYLHNGSVPTLYDLLLPKKRDGDPENGTYRPERFWVGKREFDPVKVGIVSVDGQGSRFLTQLEGNSNAGHEYGTARFPQTFNGKLLPPLTDEECWELVEYLKTL